jgi:hypothetical protein
MITAPSYETVEKIGYEDGVFFTMEVYELPDGFYKCRGYAMASSIKIAEWHYTATDQQDAYSYETREYLLRELRPMVRTILEHLHRTAKAWIAN